MGAGRLVRVKALVLLLGIPIVEIVVAVWVAGLIGVGWMLLLLLGLTLLGLFLLPKVGLGGLRRLQVVTQQGERPGPELVNSGLLMVAALLLIIPGFVTAAVGLAAARPPGAPRSRPLVGPALHRRGAGDPRRDGPERRRRDRHLVVRGDAVDSPRARPPVSLPPR